MFRVKHLPLDTLREHVIQRLDRAGAPANVTAGVMMLKGVGDIVARDEPLFEIHAESRSQLEAAKAYANPRPELVVYGF